MVSKPLKICIVTRRIGTTGKEAVGIGRVSYELIKGLLSRGHEVASIDSPSSSLISYFLDSTIGTPFKLPKGYDIYHALGPIESLWLPKGRTVVTFMDMFQYGDTSKLGAGQEKWVFNKLGPIFYKFCCEVAYKKAFRLASISLETKKDMVLYLGREAEGTKVIKLGIPENLEPRYKELGFIVFGYLGVLDKRKRVDLLIETFKKVNKNLDVILVIAGRGPEKEKLEALAKEDKRILFYGYIPEVSLSNYYNSLDFFISPTSMEGYGLPLVEAMACGKPVIVFKDADIPEEIGSKCIKISNSIKGRVEALESLCKGEFKKEEYPIEENYRWAKEHSWNKMVEQYLEVYKDIIDDKRTS